MDRAEQRVELKCAVLQNLLLMVFEPFEPFEPFELFEPFEHFDLIILSKTSPICTLLQALIR